MGVKFEDCDRLMVAQSAMYGAYALATGLDPSRANKTFYNDSVMSNSHKGATQWCSAHLAGLSAVHGAMSTVSLSKDDRRKLAWVGTGAHAAQAGGPLAGITTPTTHMPNALHCAPMSVGSPHSSFASRGSIWHCFGASSSRPCSRPLSHSVAVAAYVRWQRR